jgi:hypothetical protein
MKVLKNKSDNIILGTLILLSLYQTTKLWFGDFTDYNFFYNVNNAIDTNIESGKEYFTEPREIRVGRSNNKFMILDVHKAKFADVYKEYTRMLNNALNEGEYKGKENIKLSELYKKDFIEALYATDLNSDILNEEFNIKEEKNINKISKFDRIYVSFENEKKTLYFYRDYSRVADVIEYKIEDSKLASEIKELRDIDVINAVKVNINGYRIIPFNKKDERVSLTDFMWKNPISSDEGVDSYANTYFENPSNVWKKEDNKNDVIIYGDDLNTVRYHRESGLVEYSNNEIKGSSKMDFIKSYYIARTFMEQDEIYPIRDIYLKSYIETEEGYNFKFEYLINNFTYLNKDKISIEVLVEGNKVKTLKRYLRKLSVSRLFMAKMKSYIEIANEYAKNYEIADIRDMYMGYVLDDSDRLDLSWIIENKDGKKYVFNAYERVK